MFTIGDSTAPRQIFLALGVTDLRRGFNGLYAMIQHELQGKPLSGDIYVFCNRKRDAVKLYMFDAGGIWVCAKRLEEGTFKWPDRGDRKVQLTMDDLQRLLTGMDVITPRRVRDRWFDPDGMPQQHPGIPRQHIVQQHA